MNFTAGYYLYSDALNARVTRVFEALSFFRFGCFEDYDSFDIVARHACAALMVPCDASQEKQTLQAKDLKRRVCKKHCESNLALIRERQTKRRSTPDHSFAEFEPVLQQMCENYANCDADTFIAAAAAAADVVGASNCIELPQLRVGANGQRIPSWSKVSRCLEQQQDVVTRAQCGFEIAGDAMCANVPNLSATMKTANVSIRFSAESEANGPSVRLLQNGIAAGKY